LNFCQKKEELLELSRGKNAKVYKYSLLNIERPLMKRSKLEMYIDSLKVLACEGPLMLEHIIGKANIDCGVLHEYLDFLIKQGLVEKRKIDKERTVFAVTERGVTVLRFFGELKDVPQIDGESRKQIDVLF
jgi:predicted transcriptional regulator